MKSQSLEVLGLAWRRLERGEKVRERHVTFPNLPSMLTPKRLELLQDVHREPAWSVKALAERLGRDYKRVHEDVEIKWHYLMLSDCCDYASLRILLIRKHPTSVSHGRGHGSGPVPPTIRNTDSGQFP